MAVEQVSEKLGRSAWRGYWLTGSGGGQREGIEKAKAKGVYRGRKASIDRNAVKHISLDGMSARAIAERLGRSLASIYRLVGKPAVDPLSL